jgi:hypothetical protein
MTVLFYNVMDGLKTILFQTFVFEEYQKLWLVRSGVGGIIMSRCPVIYGNKTVMKNKTNCTAAADLRTMCLKDLGK